MEKLSRFTGAWFPLIVLIAAAIALLTPDTFSSWGPAVPWMLAVIMLGMGMTLTLADFKNIGRRPLALMFGVVAQYTIMPLIGYLLAVLLSLPPELAVGMVLVGAAPGGTASNVMVYLARGDTALSVAMTTVSTLLAPFLTPLLVLWLGGTFLPVSGGDLFVSILQIVLVPIIAGILLRILLPRMVNAILPILPFVSVLGVTAVVVTVVGGSADTLLAVGLLLVVAVVLHNLAGLTIGYIIAKLCRQPVSGCRAISIEVGMQNSGLAAALATAHFSPAAALPAAIFSVWHNVSGSLVAGFWSRREPADVVANNGELAQDMKR